MDNIYKYIDQYSIYTFDEYPFNEIDATLFSFISYVDYEEIVEKEKLLLKDVGRMHFGLHNKEEKNITAVRDATKLLNYIKDTNRYKNCYLFNYEYDSSNDIQFSAISIEFQKNKVYVSYEGTNSLISGWKENFILGCTFPTESHKKAINYLNRHYTFKKVELYVGGHSKGGNLALVSSMYSNFLVKNRIVKIYNMDGPGLLDKEYNSYNYKKVLPKYIHIMPENSMVGIIMKSSNKEIIKTSTMGPLAHDILYWCINNDRFIPSTLNIYSKELEKALETYQKEHTKEELENATNNIYSVFVKAKIVELQDLKDIKNIKSLLKESTNLDEESRRLLVEFVGIIIKSLGSGIYNNFKELIKIKK